MKTDIEQLPFGEREVPVTRVQDACDLLDADHFAVKHLFVEYARMAMAMPTESTNERQAIAMKICEELTIHATIEEEIFYPAVAAAVPDAADLVEEGKAEHAEVKQLVAQIQSLPAAGDEMDKLVTLLAGSVEHHVKEERCELFPKARASSSLDLVAIAGELKARQQALQQA